MQALQSACGTTRPEVRLDEIVNVDDGRPHRIGLGGDDHLQGTTESRGIRSTLVEPTFAETQTKVDGECGHPQSKSKRHGNDDCCGAAVGRRMVFHQQAPVVSVQEAVVCSNRNVVVCEIWMGGENSGSSSPVIESTSCSAVPVTFPPRPLPDPVRVISAPAGVVHPVADGDENEGLRRRR